MQVDTIEVAVTADVVVVMEVILDHHVAAEWTADEVSSISTDELALIFNSGGPGQRGGPAGRGRGGGRGGGPDRHTRGRPY